VQVVEVQERCLLEDADHLLVHMKGVVHSCAGIDAPAKHAFRRLLWHSPNYSRFLHRHWIAGRYLNILLVRIAIERHLGRKASPVTFYLSPNVFPRSVGQKSSYKPGKAAREGAGRQIHVDIVHHGNRIPTADNWDLVVEMSYLDMISTCDVHRDGNLVLAPRLENWSSDDRLEIQDMRKTLEALPVAYTGRLFVVSRYDMRVKAVFPVRKKAAGGTCCRLARSAPLLFLLDLVVGEVDAHGKLDLS